MQRNPIIQFIKHWKKHGLKQTLKDWKRNFLILQTPELIIKQKIQGSIAMIIGLTIILSVLIWGKIYYAIVAVLAGMFIQYVSLKEFSAQQQVIRELKEKYEELKE